LKHSKVGIGIGQIIVEETGQAICGPHQVPAIETKRINPLHGLYINKEIEKKKKEKKKEQKNIRNNSLTFIGVKDCLR
jgi:hypothetical protein